MRQVPGDRGGLEAEAKGEDLMVRIRPLFAWYDFWVGVFIDTRKRRAYILPLPCIGFVVEWRKLK